MGKTLIQQKRGKGSPKHRAPSFKYKGKIKHNKLLDKPAKGEVIDLIHCPGHNSPLAQIRYDTGEIVLINAPEGVKVGDAVKSGSIEEVNMGNTLPLKNIPEGTSIYNIENNPGDGGRFVRSSGGFARVVTRMRNKIIVKMPSNKQKMFNPECRAIIGVIAGGGRLEKPFLKAGNKFYAMKAKNKSWPKVCGTSMNAVDHPFGGSSSHTKGHHAESSRNAPTGRKVGKIAPRRTGKKR